MKNNFDHLDALMRKTDEIESCLQWMRDTVDTPTQMAINRALVCVQTMRDGLWLVDKALEKEYSG